MLSRGGWWSKTITPLIHIVQTKDLTCKIPSINALLCSNNELILKKFYDSILLFFYHQGIKLTVFVFEISYTPDANGF